MTAPAPALALAERHRTFADSLGVLLTVPIDTPDRAAWAVEEARKLKSTLAAMTADKEAITRPLHAAWKAALAHFGPPIAAVEGVIRGLAGNAAAYQGRARESQRLALEAAAASSSPTEIAKAVAITATPPAGLHEMTVWDCEITDAGQVPREFLIVDTAALRAKAKTEKESFNVPGCKAVGRKVPVLR
jgi:hypothetical protein